MTPVRKTTMYAEAADMLRHIAGPRKRTPTGFWLLDRTDALKMLDGIAHVLKAPADNLAAAFAQFYLANKNQIDADLYGEPRGSKPSKQNPVSPPREETSGGSTDAGSCTSGGDNGTPADPKN